MTSSAEGPASRGARRRVLILDPFPVVRHGLAQALAQEGDLMVVAGLGDPAEGARVASDLVPDVVVTELTFPAGGAPERAASGPRGVEAESSDGGSASGARRTRHTDVGGLELVRALRAACPSAAILVLSAQDPDVYAERAVRAGANGFVSKREELPSVVRAIRRVLTGAVHLDERVASVVVEGAGRGPRLTDRELQVLEHLGRGLRSREIAEAMGLSEKTIEGYRAQLRAKLGLADAAALLQHAIRFVKLHQA